MLSNIRGRSYEGAMTMIANDSSSAQAGKQSGDGPGGSLPDPWCSACGTDEYLVFDAVTLLPPRSGNPVSPRWDVSYWCSCCDSYYGHQTFKVPASEMETVGIDFGAEGYMHCGEPMQPVERVDHTIFDPVDASSPETGPLPLVQMHVEILRCRCGFKMEVPT